MSIPELKSTYLNDVVPALRKSMGYKNIHQVPKIEKVVIFSARGAWPRTSIRALRKQLGRLRGMQPKKALAFVDCDQIFSIPRVRREDPREEPIRELSSERTRHVSAFLKTRGTYRIQLIQLVNDILLKTTRITSGKGVPSLMYFV